MNLGVLTRFLAGAAVGAATALGVGALLTTGVSSEAGFGAQTAYTLSDVSGIQIDFALERTAGTSIDVPAMPTDQKLQLVSYTQVAGSAGSSGTLPQTPWLNPGIPRVPAITQFDRGPVATANCTMASGAMLARLAFGIITTGSQLRALQDVQVGGTTLRNLAAALDRGWGVRFLRGALTPLQLRAVLFAGAGAVIQGTYGEIPMELRLQKDYLAGHSIYLDGFRPPGPDGPAAYYVIDPLGRPWQGYRGDWWPADVIERFATTFGGGLVYTSWAFPGGTVPATHPILPPSAYPGATPPGGAPSPGGTFPSPGATTPTPSPTAPADPMPPSDVPQPPDKESGSVPPTAPDTPKADFKAGLSKLVGLFVHCATAPIPADCPPGLIGIITAPGAPAPTAPPPFELLKLLYADPIGPGMYRVVFQSPGGSVPAFWAWPADGSGGSVRAALVDEALLNGQPVNVATISLEPGRDYSFLATAAGEGVRASSPVVSLSLLGP